MVAVPAVSPVTRPVAEPAVATMILLLVQVPPGVESVRVMAVPTQSILAGPVIADGTDVTVSVLVTRQPEPVV